MDGKKKLTKEELLKKWAVLENDDSDGSVLATIIESQTSETQKEFRLKNTIDAFLLEMAKRWEEGCEYLNNSLQDDTMVCKGLALMEDMPDSHGDISFGDLINELKSRVKE